MQVFRRLTFELSGGEAVRLECRVRRNYSAALVRRVRDHIAAPVRKAPYAP